MLATRIFSSKNSYSNGRAFRFARRESPVMTHSVCEQSVLWFQKLARAASGKAALGQTLGCQISD